jgi:hypothetical protein
MATPLKNRFSHIHVDVNVDDWMTWAVKNNISSDIIAYIQFRPDALNEMSDESIDTKTRNAFATPRSWAMADKLLKSNVSDKLSLSCVIGDPKAADLSAFIQIASELPTIAEIIEDPKKAPYPTRIDAVYALVVSLSLNVTEETLTPVMSYIERTGKEYQVCFVKNICRRDDELDTLPVIEKWIDENIDLLS